MAGLSTTDIQKKLIAIGLGVNAASQHMSPDGSYGPMTADAVVRFQQGSAFGLLVDGDAGPDTQRALSFTEYVGGLASSHFRFREFACPHCGYVNVKRQLCSALEVYRADFSPTGMSVLSGTRCPLHNRSVGGAQNSQHLYGAAGDAIQIQTEPPVQRIRRFSGIEISSRGLVCHVDVRAETGTNFTGSSVDNPAVFRWPTTVLPSGRRESQIVCSM